MRLHPALSVAYRPTAAFEIRADVIGVEVNFTSPLLDPRLTFGGTVATDSTSVRGRPLQLRPARAVGFGADPFVLSAELNRRTAPMSESKTPPRRF